MKKAFALFVLFLLPLSFAAKECVKTDFSNQHFKNLTSQGTGEQVAVGRVFTDVCTGVAQVNEYYCFNAFLRSSEEQCPAGLFCAAGKCGKKLEIKSASYTDRIARVETNIPAACFVSNALIAEPAESKYVLTMSPSIDELRHSKVKIYSGQNVFFLCQVKDGFQLARGEASIEQEPLVNIPVEQPVNKTIAVSEAVKIDYGIPFTAVFLLFIAFLYLWLSMPGKKRSRK